MLGSSSGTCRVSNPCKLHTCRFEHICAARVLEHVEFHIIVNYTRRFWKWYARTEDCVFYMRGLGKTLVGYVSPARDNIFWTERQRKEQAPQIDIAWSSRLCKQMLNARVFTPNVFGSSMSNFLSVVWKWAIQVTWYYLFKTSATWR